MDSYCCIDRRKESICNIFLAGLSMMITTPCLYGLISSLVVGSKIVCNNWVNIKFKFIKIKYLSDFYQHYIKTCIIISFFIYLINCIYSYDVVKISKLSSIIYSHISYIYDN